MYCVITFDFNMHIIVTGRHTSEHRTRQATCISNSDYWSMKLTAHSPPTNDSHKSHTVICR